MRVNDAGFLTVYLYIMLPMVLSIFMVLITPPITGI